jgi:DNA-binding CsgD family transcriptional regulator
MMIALFILVGLILTILIWNRTLQILATRRGHQLFREKVAHYETSLRVDERTKLAVELHDSLAQNLTGAFMELETAESLASGADPETLNCLARGLNNSDIAALLGISRSVVREHEMALYAKIGAANRTEAVTIALRKHLLKV